MKRCLFCLVAILFVTACSPAPAKPAATGQGESSVHLVVGTQGSVSIKRLGWSDYAPASFGAVLRNGDLLRLDGGAQATIVCSDLTLAKASSGVTNVPCKASKPVLTYGSSLIVPTRSDAPTDIPMILSPRKTKVLAARPILRWQAVSGATTYTVTVRGPNLNWSTQVTGKTEIVYPDSAPALAAGQSYKLSVAAGNRLSDEERTPGLGFTMLKPEEAQTVREGEARIRSLGLSDNAARLLTANLYASQGLNAEAIDMLEILTTAAPEPAILRALGDLYLKVGLNRLAEQRYLQALALSEKAGDIEGQAAANSALGLVFETLGNKAEAIQRTEKAIAWYQKLGDNQTIKQLQERMQALQK